MAKKKAKSAKKQTPAKMEKSSSMGWIVAAIVVIVIIAYVAMRGGQQPATTTGQNAPSAGTAGGLAPSEAPAMEKKCTVTFGIVPGSKTVVNNVVTVTFKNNGRLPIEATYFAFSSEDKTIYRKNNDLVEPAKTITYTVDLNSVATDLGSAVKTFVAFPVQDGKACENQRALITGTLAPGVTSS